MFGYIVGAILAAIALKATYNLLFHADRPLSGNNMVLSEPTPYVDVAEEMMKRMRKGNG